MSKINSGLGMGLSSLIPNKKTIQEQIKDSGKAEEAGGERILEIDIEKISANPYQPRTKFDEDALADLAESIKRQGVLQPLLVTAKGQGEYQLVAGERRLRASKIAGLKKVPAILKEMTEQKKMEAALVENIQRENLNLIEEAKVYQQLKDDYDLTLDEVAETVGKSRESVAGNLRLLNLPAEIQRFVMDGKISKSHANIVLKLNNIEDQILLAKKIVNEGLSAKEAEAIVEKKNSLGVSVIKKIGIKTIDSRLSKIEQNLSEALKTKVKISGNVNRGKIIIEFFNEEELGEVSKGISRLGN